MITIGLIVVVSLAHFWFFILESFLWATPYGRRAFKMSAEQAEATKVLAMNQGVYNLFLAGGLALALLVPDATTGRLIATYFLGCVVVAGLVGAATASRVILFVQAVPGAAALIALWTIGLS